MLRRACKALNQSTNQGGLQSKCNEELQHCLFFQLKSTKLSQKIQTARWQKIKLLPHPICAEALSRRKHEPWASIVL